MSTASPSVADLHWPLALFRHGEPIEGPCPADIDITGRSRFLVHGPRLALPAGCWRAHARFELCGEAAAYPYRVELVVGVGADHTDVWPQGAGLYEAVTPEVKSVGGLSEVRVVLLRAAFHGSFRFAGARIERCD